MKLSPAESAFVLVVSTIILLLVAFVLGSCNRPPKPAPFTPDPLAQQVIAAGNPFASPSPAEPWIKPELLDPAKGEVPGNVALRCKFEPVITKDGDAWRITFRP